MKKAFVTQVAKGGITFAGRTDSNHWITMDGPEKFGGSDAGVRPKELLLLSLAGCTGSDVASVVPERLQWKLSVHSRLYSLFSSLPFGNDRLTMRVKARIL